MIKRNSKENRAEVKENSAKILPFQNNTWMESQTKFAVWGRIEMGDC